MLANSRTRAGSVGDGATGAAGKLVDTGASTAIEPMTFKPPSRP